MARTLMGAFDSPDQADRALIDLAECGYAPEEISVIAVSNKYESKGYGDEKTMASSAGTGAVTGGVIGGLAGLLAGVGVFPALAGLFIGGPIVGALGLAGTAATTAAGAVTGAAAGGLIGALTSLGLPKETADTYESTVKNGGVVVGLSGHNEITDEARRIMEAHGARDINVIDMKEESYGADRNARDADEALGHAPGYPVDRSQPVFGERRDEVREERR
jgi:hypothetical protein